MNNTIIAACSVAGVSETELMRSHASSVARTVKPMLWFYLIREMGVPHRKVADRFACSRRNILSVIKAFSGNMEFHPSIREDYERFAASIRRLTVSTP